MHDRKHSHWCTIDLGSSTKSAKSQMLFKSHWCDIHSNGNPSILKHVTSILSTKKVSIDLLPPLLARAHDKYGNRWQPIYMQFRNIYIYIKISEHTDLFFSSSILTHIMQFFFVFSYSVVFDKINLSIHHTLENHCTRKSQTMHVGCSQRGHTM